jgi:hypothetical protein
MQIAYRIEGILNNRAQLIEDDIRDHLQKLCWVVRSDRLHIVAVRFASDSLQKCAPSAYLHCRPSDRPSDHRFESLGLNTSDSAQPHSVLRVLTSAPESDCGGCVSCLASLCLSSLTPLSTCMVLVYVDSSTETLQTTTGVAARQPTCLAQGQAEPWYDCTVHMAAGEGAQDRSS